MPRLEVSSTDLRSRFVDGRPLDSVRLRDYRSQLGVVLQDNFLFDGTVGYIASQGLPLPQLLAIGAIYATLITREVSIPDHFAGLPLEQVRSRLRVLGENAVEQLHIKVKAETPVAFLDKLPESYRVGMVSFAARSVVSDARSCATSSVSS